mgnify:CR=1 FL=1
MEKIWRGYYLRYDGMLVCVVGLIENADTGEDLVVCRQNAPKKQHYYAVGRESFLDTVECGGKRVPKYRRCSKSRSVTETEARLAYELSGEYPPEETVRKKAPASLAPGGCAYAKIMCESYLHDLRLYRAGISGADEEEYIRAKENVRLLQECLGGCLQEYAAYFRERFVEGLSIRKYAEKHGLNRGSVAYIQKKFFAALALCLEERGCALCNPLPPQGKDGGTGGQGASPAH